MYKLLINQDNRVCGTSLWGFEDIEPGYKVLDIEGDINELGYEISDYVLLNGEFVYDPLPYDNVSEFPSSFITTEDLTNKFNQFTEDYDSVVCELYEQSISQQNLLAEQDAAICELYELIVSS